MAKVGHLAIRGFSTKIIAFGRWVEDDRKSKRREEDGQIVIVVIPGAPGIPDFYVNFMEVLHEETGFPVWAAGYVGFNRNPEEPEDLPLEGGEEAFGVKGQIDHQAAFVAKFVPKDAKIIFVGHSFGAHIVLELLKIEAINPRVVHSFLLTPTIEKLPDVVFGKLVLLVQKIKWLWLPALHFLAKTQKIRHFITCVACRILYVPRTEENLRIIAKELVNASAAEKFIDLGGEAVAAILERDGAILASNAGKITVYYAENDGWTPPWLVEGFRKEVPGLEAVVCSNFGHYFMFSCSEIVGKMLASRISRM